MKKIIIIMLISSACFAEDYNRKDWTWYNTIVELSFIGITVIEWRQSYLIEQNGGKNTNPIYGRNPSLNRINLLNTWAIMGHMFVAYNLPDPYRSIWQMLFIGWQYQQVYTHYEHHVSAGVNIKF